MSKTGILVADDSVTIQKVFELAFESEDVDIMLAGDGAKALQMAVEKRPSLVIADVNMPEMDGFTLCNRLRENPATKSIPVYLLSSALDEFDEKQAEQAGAAGRFEKPFKSEDMVAKVLEILRSTPEPEAKPSGDDTFEDIDVPLDSIMETVGLSDEAAESMDELDEQFAAVEEAPAPANMPKMLDLSAAEMVETAEGDEELAVEILSGDEGDAVEEELASAPQNSPEDENLQSSLADQEVMTGVYETASMDDELSEEARKMLKAIESADSAIAEMEPKPAPAQRGTARPLAAGEDIEAIVEKAVRRVFEEIKNGYMAGIINEAVESAVADKISAGNIENAIQAAVRGAVNGMAGEMMGVFQKAVTDTTLAVAENLVKQTIDQIKSGA
ncbi:MAG: response regulator [Nitrospinae bacterium]|nr:response regulator [Nitrospinota bacterium]